MQEVTKLEHVLLAFDGDADGAFKGAHAQYFTRILNDDGSEFARQLGKVTTITDAAAEGFTWPEVSTQINAGLVLANERLMADNAALKEENSILLAKLNVPTADEPATATGALAWIKRMFS